LENEAFKVDQCSTYRFIKIKDKSLGFLGFRKRNLGQAEDNTASVIAWGPLGYMLHILQFLLSLPV